MINILLGLVLRFPTLPFTLFFLAVLSYYDLKKREIPLGVLLTLTPGLVISFIAYLVFYGVIFGFRVIETVLSFVMSAIVAAVVFVLAKGGQMGYGDVIVTFLVGIINPYLLPMPIAGVRTPMIVYIIVFGIAYAIIEVVGNIVHNLKRYNMFSKVTENLDLAEKLYFLMVGKVFTNEEFKKLKFHFPLIDSENKRRIARVGVEPLEGSEFSVKGEYVIVAKGFAYTCVLLVGYILTLIYILVLVQFFHVCV